MQSVLRKIVGKAPVTRGLSTLSTRGSAAVPAPKIHNKIPAIVVSKSAFSTLINEAKPAAETETYTAVPKTSESSPITPVGPAIDPALLSGDFTLHSLLNHEQKDLLRSIKAILTQAIVDLRPLNLTKQDIQLLRNANEALDELFLVVVVGEFNSGKSNFINALLGAKHCRTGVLPTTETVQILRYGEKREEKMTGPNRNIRTVSVPVPWLRQANLVDTPGTNAVLQDHQEITEKFVPSADIILFVTSVERPFSESEKQFLSRIHSWKKKVVLVLNKADLVVPAMETQGLADIFSATPSSTLLSSSHSSTAHPFEDGTIDHGTSFGQILDFVRTNAKTVLGEAPPVFGVSSRLALDGKLAMTAATSPTPNQPKLSAASATAATLQGRALVANSGFADLENYILSQLTAENKIKLKMSNPLALMEHLLNKYEVVLEARLNALERDLETRAMLTREIADFRSETQHDFEQQLVKLDNIFLRMKQASGNFLNKQVRLLNVGSLVLQKDKLQKDYLDQVHKGVSSEVDDAIRTLSSWLVSKTAKQAHSLATIIQRATPIPIPVPAATPAIPLSAPVLMSEPEEIEDIILAAQGTASAPVIEETALDLGQQAEAVRAAGVDFHQQRLEMIHEMHAQCNEIVAEEKRVEQTQRLISSINKSVVATAAVEVSAVGLGAIFAAAFFDVTGLASAGALAAAGLVVLPSQRSRLTKDVNAKIDEMHNNLKQTLVAQYMREIEAAERSLSQSVSPFNRFVSHEEERLNEIKTKVERVRAEINRIRTELAK